MTRHGELVEEAPCALVNINSLPMVYDLAGRLIDSTSYRIIWPFCLIFLSLAMVLMTQVRPRR